jgi:hypothetical protein
MGEDGHTLAIHCSIASYDSLSTVEKHNTHAWAPEEQFPLVMVIFNVNLLSLINNCFAGLSQKISTHCPF